MHGIFVSEDVRASVERTMALIADASERGGGMLALDFTDTLMRRDRLAELKARRPPRYEIRFTLTSPRRPFYVHDRIDGATVRHFRTLHAARNTFPNSRPTPEAEEAAILRGETI